MRMLITGAGGMLAQELVPLGRSHNHDIVALTHRELDVCDAEALRVTVETERPEVIVNCAAWTDVDGAEAAEAAALELNGAAPGLLAAAARVCDARLIHISSDYVFDGTSQRAYVESDATAPQSAYGRTKLAGEQAVAAVGGPHAIVRTSWLFGRGGRNFVATMLGLAADGREEVAVVSDQVGCPTFAGHLAGALIEVAERGLNGLMHIAGGGHCSWAQLAGEAFSQTGTACVVRPVDTAAFPRPARRPAHSVLESERPELPRLPSWQDGLAAYLAEVTQGLAR